MFYDQLKSRRSIRKYADRQVEGDKLDTILKSALLAPSANASRPWHFIAVTDKELLFKLSKCKAQYSQFLAGAPLGIVVITDPEASNACVEDASIAAVIMQLSAQALGLGSCWIHVRGRLHSDTISSEDYIKALLGIPDKFMVECIIAAGYPAEERKPYSEEDLLKDRIHFNRY